MKFCAKCGNALKDDMLYCQKCGEKFETALSSETEILLNQLNKMNIILPINEINYEHIVFNSEKSGKLLEGQENIKNEIISLGQRIIKSANDTNLEDIKKSVYMYYLTQAEGLVECTNSLLMEYSFVENSINECVRVLGNSEEGRQLYSNLVDADGIYKVFSWAQSLFARDLRVEIPKEDLINNDYLQQVIERILNKILSAVEIDNIRTKVLLSRNSDDLYDTFADLCEKFMEGVSNDCLSKLKLDAFIQSNHAKNKLERKILELRNEEIRIRKEVNLKKQHEEDQKYWEEHPQELALRSAKQDEIDKLNTKVAKIDLDVNSINNNLFHRNNRYQDLEVELTSNNAEIKSLEKKIFGKKSAELHIISLKDKNTKIDQEKILLKNENQEYEAVLTKINNDKMDLQNQIKLLQEDIKQLRNK